MTANNRLPDLEAGLYNYDFLIPTSTQVEKTPIASLLKEVSKLLHQLYTLVRDRINVILLWGKHAAVWLSSLSRPTDMGRRNTKPRNPEATLETLPVELKFEVLYCMPDLHTLSILIHASPKFHSAYTTLRPRLLPIITFRSLAARNIDVFRPAPARQAIACNKHFGHPSHMLYLETIIKLCRSEALDDPFFNPENPTRSVDLTIEQCLALLTIEEVTEWEFVGPPGFEVGIFVGHDPREAQQWMTVLNFTKYSSVKVQ